uniref:RING-type domain-containing protein n=1 Tax=Chromera velia CCMP2878 TaxID=1169474 RepID=A0A0G4F2V4_9ALVE|eukprot:Cvel_14712.t1-p1 / transcript=Cvel_14712.t1 / gene=Cvel_14712 / organism=Chromera_velia_CCMP2878 / gene_product=hypothetical protein / transcript_product=hypothetical protein / location=Cvel_scaffold1057:13926-19804(-) / protein_length=1106 / sequence_SO=supercontig / SO=protein_coding / is_pseudo=false
MDFSDEEITGVGQILPHQQEEQQQQQQGHLPQLPQAVEAHVEAHPDHQHPQEAQQHLGGVPPQQAQQTQEQGQPNPATLLAAWEDLERSICCPSCDRFLHEPKMVPTCGHVCCFRCLQQPGEQDGAGFTCPVCGAVSEQALRVAILDELLDFLVWRHVAVPMIRNFFENSVGQSSGEASTGPGESSSRPQTMGANGSGVGNGNGNGRSSGNGRSNGNGNGNSHGNGNSGNGNGTTTRSLLGRSTNGNGTNGNGAASFGGGNGNGNGNAHHSDSPSPVLQQPLSQGQQEPRQQQQQQQPAGSPRDLGPVPPAAVASAPYQAGAQAQPAPLQPLPPQQQQQQLLPRHSPMGVHPPSASADPVSLQNVDRGAGRQTGDRPFRPSYSAGRLPSPSPQAFSSSRRGLEEGDGVGIEGQQQQSALSNVHSRVQTLTPQVRPAPVPPYPHHLGTAGTLHSHTGTAGALPSAGGGSLSFRGGTVIDVSLPNRPLPPQHQSRLGPSQEVGWGGVGGGLLPLHGASPMAPGGGGEREREPPPAGASSSSSWRPLSTSRQLQAHTAAAAAAAAAAGGPREFPPPPHALPHHHPVLAPPPYAQHPGHQVGVMPPSYGEDPPGASPVSRITTQLHHQLQQQQQQPPHQLLSSGISPQGAAAAVGGGVGGMGVGPGGGGNFPATAAGSGLPGGGVSASASGSLPPPVHQPVLPGVPPGPSFAPPGFHQYSHHNPQQQQQPPLVGGPPMLGRDAGEVPVQPPPQQQQYGVVGGSTLQHQQANPQIMPFPSSSLEHQHVLEAARQQQYAGPTPVGVGPGLAPVPAVLQPLGVPAAHQQMQMRQQLAGFSTQTPFEGPGGLAALQCRGGMASAASASASSGAALGPIPAGVGPEALARLGAHRLDRVRLTRDTSEIPRESGPLGSNLFCCRLPEWADELDLRRLVASVGLADEFRGCRVLRHEAGVSKNAGYISFSSPMAAFKALNLLDGAQLAMEPADARKAAPELERKAGGRLIIVDVRRSDLSEMMAVLDLPSRTLLRQRLERNEEAQAFRQRTAGPGPTSRQGEGAAGTNAGQTIFPETTIFVPPQLQPQPQPQHYEHQQQQQHEQGSYSGVQTHPFFR